MWKKIKQNEQNKVAYNIKTEVTKPIFYFGERIDY